MPLQTRQGTPEKRKRRSKRRHIRCDEKHPQCQNCIKHKAVCSYSHSPTHEGLLLDDSHETTPFKSRRPWPDKVKAEHRLTIMGVSKLTVISSYLPSFFRIIPMSRLAMNGVLALSAHQVASVTDSKYARLKKDHYQILAIQELIKCLPNLKPEHVDGALAASMALLWLCEDMSVHHVSLGIGDTDTFRSSRGMIAAGISAHIISEMWKFDEILKSHESCDGTRRQLSLLIALAEGMVKVEPITSAGKQSGWLQLLRYFKLSLPLRDLITCKNISGILMVNAYLHAVALYSPPHPTQPYLIDLRVDLQNLLDETLQQTRPIDAYVRLLDELKAIVSPR
ncbi:hypothetical protein FOXB_13136 [Fusarium oxysporum f. sp. conglutinans Fo5176]|uniref:Zn(2)-C6 fungal-type domain-containing protein n=1 Tax=Fusarium oxysporum (strain Fo5176) TaxID=660025 RepID=F9G3A4_FUSOF|nr:hypothetical protein FOXB_13136 [Fusarium oxysporum f. sp. conglutinans Fo5176]